MKRGSFSEDTEVILTSHQVAIIYIYIYVKHVSCKNIILEGIKRCKKWLKIHANSLSDALVPSQKKIACGAGPPAALRGFGIYARNAQSMPDSCQKAWIPPPWPRSSAREDNTSNSSVKARGFLTHYCAQFQVFASSARTAPE